MEELGGLNRLRIFRRWDRHVVWDDAWFVWDIVTFRADNLTCVEDETVTVRCVVCSSNGGCTPGTGYHDHVADTVSATVATERLSKAFAGARWNMGASGRAEGRTQSFCCRRVCGTVDRQSIGGEKRDVGSEQKDSLSRR
jgi:hypothetical protein